MDAMLQHLTTQRDLYTPVLDRIEWCPTCQGRHGVFRNVEKKDEQLVAGVINYFYGNKGQWWKKNTSKTMDVEFVPMCKVSPPPRKPWEWCGKTILFEDWRQRESDDRLLANQFKIGQTVTFTVKGAIIKGIISGLNKRAKVIIPGQENWWHVPYNELHAL